MDAMSANERHQAVDDHDLPMISFIEDAYVAYTLWMIIIKLAPSSLKLSNGCSSHLFAAYGVNEHPHHYAG